MCCSNLDRKYGLFVELFISLIIAQTKNNFTVFQIYFLVNQIIKSLIDRKYNKMHHKTLHIKLTQLKIKSTQNLFKSYYSFQFNDEFYFSSYFDSNSSTQNLNDDIIIPLVQTNNQNNRSKQQNAVHDSPRLVPNILIQRWENHMIMFTHQLDLSQLKSKTMLKKSVQMRQGQILYFTCHIVEPDQLIFSKSHTKNMNQHYIKVRGLQFKQNKRRGDPGPSFFIVATSTAHCILPVANGTFVLQIPDKIRFMHYRNGQLFGTTESLRTEDLSASTMNLQLLLNNRRVGQMKIQFEWGINLQKQKNENNLLLESHQVMLYDFQVKFQNFNQFANSKIKIVYGTKAFQLIGDYNSKNLKFKKIVFFMMKSQDQQISIVLQKNGKFHAQCKFFSDQLIPFQVSNIKKKIGAGRVLLTIKFRGQKGKNLSIPQNNTLWKQLSKKKTTNVSFIIAIQQISIKYQTHDQLLVSFKTDQRQQQFAPVSNINFFQKQNLDYHHERVLLPVKPQQSIYVMLRRHQGQRKKNNQLDQNQFIGVSVLNHTTVRIGKSAIELSLYKNQQKTATINFLINKIPPFPFIKGLFQPEIITMSNAKIIGLNLFINKIFLTPYYFSYQYDGKNQLYCVVEVNRVKKVLILDQSEHERLILICSAGSDNLQFLVQQQDYVKIKLTLMISDVGKDQEIYATAFIKCKTSELFQQLGMDFHDVQLKNSARNTVGVVSLQLHRGVSDLSRDKVQYKDEVKKIQHDISKVNQSVQFLQKSLQKDAKTGRGSINSILQSPIKVRKRNNSYEKYTNQNTSMSKESSNINLPIIKQKKKQQNKLEEMLTNLRVRKRGVGGTYEDPQSGSKILEHRPPPNSKFNLQSIQKTNPNLQRNFQILFPKKNQARKFSKDRQARNIHYMQNDSRLKGMKSVMKQISNDIGEVQATVKSSRENNQQDIDVYIEEGQSREEHPEWQGNEFAMHNL